MTDPFIRVDRAPGRLIVTLDRAAKANALTAAMMGDLADALRGARADDLVVLRSASPKLFCAGADIAEFVAGPGALARQEHALLAMIDALADCEAPIVAVARGRAAGGGALLLCLADVVVAADDLVMAAPEFVFGMYPVIVEAILRSRLAPALSTRLCLGAGALDAPSAHALGLVTEVLSADGFDATANDRLDWYADRIAGLRALRRSRLVSTATAEMRRQLQATAPLMLENFAAPGVRERIAAYVAGLAARAR